jgi:hypothetical protein
MINVREKTEKMTDKFAEGKNDRHKEDKISCFEGLDVYLKASSVNGPSILSGQRNWHTDCIIEWRSKRTDCMIRIILPDADPDRYQCQAHEKVEKLYFFKKNSI